MSTQQLAFFILAFLFKCNHALCFTPEVNIHAVVITSEYIKPRSPCQQTDNGQFIKTNTTTRLTNLRRVMAQENVSAYIVLSNDDHQSETVSDHDKRLMYISGFSGSNGIAVITHEAAALWTDSRYYTQAEDELDCNWLVMRMGTPGTPTIEDWLATQLETGSAVSTDPKISAYEKWLNWEKNLSRHGLTMKLVKTNLVDVIWTDGRPPYPKDPIFVLSDMFTGMRWEDKLSFVREEMKKANLDVFVMTALDEIAWTLNLRGKDIPYFPVFRSYFIIEADKSFLYLPEKKTTREVIDHLNSNSTTGLMQIKHYNEIWTDLPLLAAKYDKIGLPSKYSYFNGISYLLYSSIPEEKRILLTSPVLVKKEIKNPVEAAGMKASHIRDGLVVCQLLSRMEEEIAAGSGNWTEMRVVEVINNMRKEQMYNSGISFGTIAAFGKNAANAHYEPTPQTDTVIDTSQLFMLDSGGQYYDGTTDCTRTVHFGIPKDIEKEIYTRLLIGCINLATTIFKEGYTLKQLEIIIRSPLYELGLDYGHGTTHGIGSFLAVHESFNSTYHVNFFGSQEPGYYKENEFGMRLENIVRVIKAPGTSNEKRKTFLTFETVTLIPYETKLIKFEMLDKRHLIWLNDYHQRVRELVGTEMLKQGLKKEYNWLVQKTQPIAY